MKLYHAAGWLAASILSVCVGVSSYVVTNEVKAPAAAYAVRFPPAGTARANYAMMTYGIRVLKAPGAMPAEDEVMLAGAAYRAEPLSSTALSLIMPTIREGETRRSLLARTGELTRRNSLLNEEQIKAAAARGDDTGFFRWLSRAMLTSYDVRAAYVGAMAEASAKEGAVAALTPVLGPAPSWSGTYWGQVVQRPASLANAAKLRVAVARAPWHQTEISRTDQYLMAGLTIRGQFEAAHSLYIGLLPDRAERVGNLLSNGSFEWQPQLPPFDWQLAVSGALGASIDEKDKSLLVSAIGGARGFAARQLVHLAPGTYRLSWLLSTSTPIDSSTLSARVICAEPGVKSTKTSAIHLLTGRHSASFVIPEGTCRWHWLSIDIVLPDDSPGVDAYFGNISLLGEERQMPSRPPVDMIARDPS